VHPEIENPDYKADATIGQYSDAGAVGFELWQVKAGTIFDNILLTDPPYSVVLIEEESAASIKKHCRKDSSHKKHR